MSCKFRLSNLGAAPLVLLGVLGTLFLCIIYYLLVVNFVEPNQRSEFGELFGGLVALFNGLAFAGVIGTLYFQRVDLNLQLKEFKSQTETFVLQSFETRFFEWLKLHHEIVNAIDLRDTGISDVINRGRDCFKTFLRSVEARFYENLKKATCFQDNNGETVKRTRERLFIESSNNPNINHKEILINSYLEQYSFMQGDVGHYFRNMYRLILFIDQSKLPEHDKPFYVKIIRAQLSSYELALLFYNCLSPFGCEKFYPLIEKYALLKNMDRNLLFYPSHKTYYSPLAYGEK